MTSPEVTVITLFDVPISPYAQKVKLALLEKALPFTCQEEDLTRPSDELRALSPRLEVPVLVDGDARLYGSSIIVAYLDETYPEHALLPRSPRERARVRAIEELCDTAYEAVVWGVSELTMFHRGSDELKQSMLARANTQVASLNARLESELQGRAFLNGEQFGLADLAAFPHVNAAAFQGNKPTAGGPLDEWLRATRKRPSVQRCKQDIVASMPSYAALSQRILGGEAKRHYRDHRLDWMLRSGGHQIVEQGVLAGNIRFSLDL